MNRVIDPVCGMEVDPQAAAAHTGYEGSTYYFCARSCKTRFDAEPAGYLNKGSLPPQPPPAFIQLGGFAHSRQAAVHVIEGERVDLPVTGMTCAACARHIEQKLATVPGALRAAVNFATSRATVEYTPGTADTGSIKKAIEDLGYGVREAGGPGGMSDEASEEAAGQAEYGELKKRFLVAAILSPRARDGHVAWPRLLASLFRVELATACFDDPGRLLFRKAVLPGRV